MQVVYVGGGSLEAGVGCRESEAWEVYVLLDYCFRQPEPGSAQALQGVRRQAQQIRIKEIGYLHKR